MSTTILKNKLMVKDSSGKYITMNAIADATTAEKVAAVDAAKNNGIATLNAKVNGGLAALNNADEVVGMIASAFSDTAVYKIGDYVIYPDSNNYNHLYRFTIAHTAGAWNADDVIEVLLSQDIALTNSDLSIIYGCRRINDFITGTYIKTDTATIELTRYTADKTFSSCIVECKEGDLFTLSGYGGTVANLWCFIDSTNKVLAKAATTANYSDSSIQIMAPAKTSKLIINVRNTYNYWLYAGELPTQALIQYDRAQTLTEEQQLLAQSNIGLTIVSAQDVLEYIGG